MKNPTSVFFINPQYFQTDYIPYNIHLTYVLLYGHNQLFPLSSVRSIHLRSDNALQL